MNDNNVQADQVTKFSKRKLGQSIKDFNFQRNGGKTMLDDAPEMIETSRMSKPF
jgi:hypothetical protein